MQRRLSIRKIHASPRETRPRPGGDGLPCELPGPLDDPGILSALKLPLKVRWTPTVLTSQNHCAEPLG